jgi:hypothetical protein
MIEIKATPMTREVVADIRAFPRTFQSGLNVALQDIGSDLVSEEQKLIRRRNKTGRLYYFRGRLHRASAPGEVPAFRTGRLSKSTDYRRRNHLHLVFGQQAEYAVFLANGTRKMAPRANLKQAMDNKVGRAAQIIAENVTREAKLA